jgi:hypothetical protein
VSPVRYDLDFDVPEDGILHSDVTIIAITLKHNCSVPLASPLLGITIVFLLIQGLMYWTNDQL